MRPLSEYPLEQLMATYNIGLVAIQAGIEEDMKPHGGARGQYPAFVAYRKHSMHEYETGETEREAVEKLVETIIK